MDDLFKYLGRKAGKAYNKGRWYYRSVFGSEEEAMRAEAQVGKEMADEITRSIGTTRERDKQELVERVGQRLAARLTDDRREFHFNVIPSEEYNAFALPGGYIFATRGLLRLYEYREDELAFVLAHEIAHVVRGHPFDRVLASNSVKILARLGRGGGILGNLAAGTIQNLVQKSYSQDQELDADGFAVRLMNAARYDAGRAEEAMWRLSDVSRRQPKLFTYFSTHPGKEKRVREIRYQLKRLA